MPPQYIDIKLTQGNDGIWDISLDEDGDLEKDEGFSTTIGLTLSGRRRADEGEVFIPQKREGWIGNLLPAVPGYERGSKLWLYQQARLTPSLPAQLRNETRESLEWMVEDDLARNITVTGRQSDSSKVLVEISIDGEPLYFDLWNNTTL